MFGGSSQLTTTAEVARGNQIVVHNSDNETVLGSSRMPEGPAEQHVIEKRSNMIVSTDAAQVSFTVM